MKYGFVMATVLFAAGSLAFGHPCFGADVCSLTGKLLELPPEQADALFKQEMSDRAQGKGKIKETTKTGRSATQRTIIVECAEGDGFVYLTGAGMEVAGLGEGQQVSFQARCTHWKKLNYENSEKQYISFGCYEPMIQ